MAEQGRAGLTICTDGSRVSNVATGYAMAWKTGSKFVCLIILAYNLSRSWRHTFCPVFLSAVRAVTARCKLPLCPLPGPPERLLRTKEIDKGKDRRKNPARPLLLPRRCPEGWGGQEQRLLTQCPAPPPPPCAPPPARGAPGSPIPTPRSLRPLPLPQAALFFPRLLL